MCVNTYVHVELSSCRRSVHVCLDMCMHMFKHIYTLMCVCGSRFAHACTLTDPFACIHLYVHIRLFYEFSVDLQA